jgi:hypothetical protein
MIRTAVAAPGVWPQTNVLAGHARVVRSFLTITARPPAARNLFVRTEHRGIITREEGSRSARIGAQLKTAMVSSQYITGLKGEEEERCRRTA